MSMTKLLKSKYSSIGEKMYQLQQIGKELKEKSNNQKKRLGFQDINEYFLNHQE